MTGPRWGAELILTSSSGIYTPDDHGEPAAVLGVEDRYGECVDVVAWFPDKPSAWWLRYGDECPVLGARALAIAAYHHDTVALCSTPERWLIRRAPPAVVVLDWGADLGPLFAGVSHIQCDSVGLHDRLQQAIRSWEPEITAPGQNLPTSEGFREARHAA